MKQDRRSFIRAGGLTLVASGIVPAFLQSCKPGTGKSGTGVGGAESNGPGGSDPEIAGTAVLSDLTSGVEPLSDEEYRSKQEKVRGLMQKQGVDALWIEGGPNMKYFFDVNWWLSERVFGVVLPADGDPVWICPAFEGPRAGRLIRFGNDIRTWQEDESPYRLLDQVFRSFPHPVKKLAVDPNVRSFVSQGIGHESKVERLDGSPLTTLCRGIKSEKELAYMDLANNITKRAYRWAFSQVQKGMKPSELRALIAAGHDSLGAAGSAMALFGSQSAFPHGSHEDPDLKDGDVILVDGGCTVEGYHSDVTRTIVAGTPSDKQKKVFEIVHKAQSAAHRAVRPGIQAGELDRIARKVIEDAGYGPGYKYFVHRLGHGIGLEGHEWPYLVKDNPLLIQPGMTFSNEPGIYIYGEFGIRIEDCFVVTEDGGRFLGGMLCNSLEEPFGT